MGRNTKLDYKIVGKLLDIFRIDWTVEEACSYAGISKDTYYQRIKQKRQYTDEKGEIFNFAEEMEKAQKYFTILARKVLYQSIKEWDAKKAIRFLEKRDRRFVERSSVDSEIHGNITIEQNIAIKGLLDENL